VVQDYFGNIIGTISGGTASWNPTHFSSYGPVPGYQSPALVVPPGAFISSGGINNVARRASMITLFHFFAFLVSIAGLVLGAVFGSKLFGWIGGILGAGFGAYISLVLGRLPRVLAIFLLRRSDKKASPDQRK